MSSFIRQTTSQKINNFTGDKYFTKKDFEKTIENPKQPKKSILEDTAKPKKHIEKKPIKTNKTNKATISYKMFILDKIYNKWILDNINELEEVFFQIINIYNKNKAEFTIDTDVLFNHFCRKIFNSKRREIMRMYENNF